ncbi:hypothetical protein M8818_007535 [Zalaria obscura]|uniref:Uncharacterized protein n=1 Tax=Zalaria obscura TaxID=2024903 RepID=A0ACC3S4J3_9PEZI
MVVRYALRRLHESRVACPMRLEQWKIGSAVDSRRRQYKLNTKVDGSCGETVIQERGIAAIAVRNGNAFIISAMLRLSNNTLTYGWKHGARNSSCITKGRVLTSTKDKLRWRDDQTWCKTSSRLRFIDETEELIGIYDESSSESATRNEDQADESDCNAPVRSEHVRSPRSPPATVAQRDATALDLEDYDDQAGLVRAFKRRRLDSSGTHESISLESPVQQSSGLLPQRAAHCPILLNAIFAVSAKHLSSLHPNYDPLISDRYHGECIKHLIPMLNDEQAVFDEDLMAATVILRYLEEVGVPVSGTTEQNHLLGTRVFLSAQDATLLNGGLREAAFWIGLRQEIYVAFVNQRSVIPTLEHLQFDQTFEPAEDHVWANRIIAHCAEVLRYCFGEDLNSMTPSRYTELTSYAENWVHMKPTSFTPMFVGTPSVLDDDVNTVFPQICPRLPRLGPGLRKALKEIDKEIRNDVIALCGMATGNSRTPPNYVTASIFRKRCAPKITKFVNCGKKGSGTEASLGTPEITGLGLQTRQTLVCSVSCRRPARPIGQLQMPDSHHPASDSCGTS